MQLEAHCYKTISLFASHHTHRKASWRIALKLKRSVLQLSLAWKSGTSTCTEDTTSQYIQIINHSRQSSRSLSARPLNNCSKWCSSYIDINFQFNTLSHAPVTNHPSTTSARKEFEVFPMELAEMDIETMQWIKHETTKNPILVSLCHLITSGWPAERKEKLKQLRRYWSFRDEISV